MFKRRKTVPRKTIALLPRSCSVIETEKSGSPLQLPSPQQDGVLSCSALDRKLLPASQTKSEEVSGVGVQHHRGDDVQVGDIVSI